MTHYKNPDAPDPFVTAAAVMQMKSGGPMTIPDGSTLASSIHPINQLSQPISMSNEEPMWTSSLCLCDSVAFGGRTMTPQQILKSCTGKHYERRTISRDETTNIITVHERNGRDVDVGDFEITSAFFINPDGKMRFEAFYCELMTNGKAYRILIPYSAFVRREILQYLPMLLRNVDCPDRYIVIAFYLELRRMSETKLLMTRQNSGWVEMEGKGIEFISSDAVHPDLTEYFPDDVKARQLVRTERPLVDIAREYQKALPGVWQYKLLTAVRIGSLLLYYFKREGIVPDHMIAVEPASESAAKVAIALTKNQNYSSQAVMQLATAKPKELCTELGMINDGTFVVRDSAVAESARTSTSRAQILADDMYGTDGKEEHSRHIAVIISDHPDYLSDDLPMMYVNLSDQICTGDPDELQRLSGEFDSALIRALVSDPINNLSLIRDAIKYSKIESKTVVNSEYYQTIKIILGGLYIMKVYKLISPDENASINEWLRNGHESNKDSAVIIDNDFCAVYNKLIFSRIPVVPQYGGFNDISGKLMIVAGKEYTHFEAGRVDRLIMQHMRSTRKKFKMLKAIKRFDHLHCNNGYKNAIRVEVSPGIYETFSVYSIPNSILSALNREKINDITKSDYFCTTEEAEKAELFRMVMNRAETKVSGQSFNLDTNLHQYIVGQSRSGKSKYLTEQAVETALHGEQVVVFDHNGSFTERELKKHLPPDIIEEFFSFWCVPNQGLPVNLADLSNCDTMPEKKQCLKSVYAAGARALGSMQEKVLNKKVASLIKAKGDDVDIVNILDYFVKEGEKLKLLSDEFTENQQVALFNSRSNMIEKMGIGSILDYLDEKDRIENALRNKLEDIFEDLEGLPKSTATWGDLLATQKKIVIISTGTDGFAKSSNLTDMMLASFYGYKQYIPDERITVIIDECQDLYLDTDGPIDIILRKGGKHGIRMLLASQEFSVLRDKLGKIIGNCGTLVFFKPKPDNLADIARLTGIDKSILAELEQGQCVVFGLLYKQSAGVNKQVSLVGFTYKHK